MDTPHHVQKRAVIAASKIGSAAQLCSVVLDIQLGQHHVAGLL
jgi:hypothetical protein